MAKLAPMLAACLHESRRKVLHFTDRLSALDASLQIPDGYCFNERRSRLIFTGTNFSFVHVLGEGFLASWAETRGLMGVVVLTFRCFFFN